MVVWRFSVSERRKTDPSFHPIPSAMAEPASAPVAAVKEDNDYVAEVILYRLYPWPSDAIL